MVTGMSYAMCDLESTSLATVSTVQYGYYVYIDYFLISDT